MRTSAVRAVDGPEKSAFDDRRNFAPVSFLVRPLEAVRTHRPALAQHMNRMHCAARILEMNQAKPPSAFQNLRHRTQVVGGNLLHRSPILRSPFKVARLMMHHVERLAIT